MEIKAIDQVKDDRVTCADCGNRKGFKCSLSPKAPIDSMWLDKPIRCSKYKTLKVIASICTPKPATKDQK